MDDFDSNITTNIRGFAHLFIHVRDFTHMFVYDSWI